MKKNAFTLIELIVTIGLIGMLSTILITLSIRKINEVKEKSKDTMIESIRLAAENYVIDYKHELTNFDTYDYIYINLQTLVEKEYFTESLIDPTTKKNIPLTNQVYVTRESNGKLNVTFDLKQREKIKMILNGSYNQYIKLGDTYEDLGVVATTKDGIDVSENVAIVGTVNTSSVGNYEIIYKIDNVQIKRNVIVYK